MCTITIFKFAEVSTYVQNTVSVRQADANFMVDSVPMGKGGYRNLVKPVAAPREECTHITIVGKSHNPNKSVYGDTHYTGRYYDHDYTYSLDEYPELREWVNNCDAFHQIGDKGQFELYRNELIGMVELPELIQRIAKGYAVKDRIDYDYWENSVGTPSAYHEGNLSFIEWAESLSVEPLIIETED